MVLYYLDLVKQYVTILLKKMIRMDYMFSKEIQRYGLIFTIISSSKLSTKAEYYLAIPTMLFGRHCVPYIILLSFLLLPIHSACFLGLSRYNLYISSYIVV